MIIFYVTGAVALISLGAMLVVNKVPLAAYGKQFLSWVILKVSGWVGK